MIFICLILLDSVDCILLDSPHHFNSNEVLVEKYYSTEDIHQLERMLLSNQKTPLPAVGDDEESASSFPRSSRHINMKIRLLNDSIASVKTSNEIQLQTIEKGFQSTIERRKKLLEQIEQLTEQCANLREQNEGFQRINQSRNEILEENYRKAILAEESEQNFWKNKLARLRS